MVVRSRSVVPFRRNVRRRQYAGAFGTGVAAARAIQRAYRSHVVRRGLRALSKRMRSSRTRTITRATPRAARRFHTTTPRVGRFKRPTRSVRDSWFARYGSVVKHEAGGVIDDANAVYVGHYTCPWEQVAGSLTRCIIKELMAQAGRAFASWDDGLGAGIDVSYNYFPNVLDQALTIRTIALAAGTKFRTIAENLLNDILIIYRSPNNLTDAVFKEFWISIGGDVMATVRADCMKCVYHCRSDLAIQNRTIANTGAGVDDPENAHNVENNPLHGKVYLGHGSGFFPAYRNEGDASYNSFHAQKNTGLILAKASQSMDNETNKPPVGSYFRGAKATNVVRLMPGSIKRNVVVYSRTLGLNRWFQLLRTEMEAPSAFQIPHSTYGTVAMVGLEKLLDSHQTTEPVVNVAFEHTMVIKCGSKYNQRPFTATIMDIEPSPQAPLT